MCGEVTTRNVQIFNVCFAAFATVGVSAAIAMLVTYFSGNEAIHRICTIVCVSCAPFVQPLCWVHDWLNYGTRSWQYRYLVWIGMLPGDEKEAEKRDEKSIPLLRGESKA